jgi:chemotaxis protein MotB
MGRMKKHEEGEGAWLVSYADMMTLLVGFFVMLMSFSKIDSEAYEKVKQATSKMFGGEYVQPQENLVKNLQTIIAETSLQEEVSFKQTDTGAEFSFPGGLFFDQGEIDLRPEAKKVLEKLVPVIMAQARGYGVVIEGHTDSVPVKGARGIATNWELSSLRACTVLRLFEANGFDRRHLKAIGWGDTRPAADSGPDEERQAKNRRVVIKVLRDFED